MEGWREERVVEVERSRGGRERKGKKEREIREDVLSSVEKCCEVSALEEDGLQYKLYINEI